MGAGILPCAYHRGKLYLLLGKERKNGLWCDFGGSPEQGETVFETAIREGMEELNGFFGNKQDLTSQVKKTHIHTVVNSRDKYTSILFKIKYDSKLPKYFNNNNTFTESYILPDMNIPTFGHIRPGHSGLFEKTEVGWFNINDIESIGFDLFRPHFTVILENIINKYSIITNKIYTQNNFDKNKTRKKVDFDYVIL